MRDSDLAFLPFTVLSILAVLATLAAFFFVGVVIGFVVLVACAIAAIIVFARFVRRNDLT